MKLLEDLGHVLIGFIPLAGWLREVWQLPPENDAHPVLYFKHDPAQERSVPYWSSVRVLDMVRDFGGYALGDLIRTAILVYLLWESR